MSISKVALSVLIVVIFLSQFKAALISALTCRDFIELFEENNRKSLQLSDCIFDANIFLQFSPPFIP